MAKKPEQSAEGGTTAPLALGDLPKEIYVDGISALHARSGVIKLICYRVTGVDREAKSERRTISHHLVLPNSAVPELVRLVQQMAQAAQRRDGDETLGDEIIGDD